MAEIGSAFVSILPSAKGFGSKLQSQVGGEVNSAGKSIGSKFGSMFKVGAAAAVGGALLAGKLVKDSIAEAREAQVVTARTENVIAKMGNAANVSAGQVADLAGAISAKTGIDDEAIQSGQNLLLTFGNIRNEAGKGNDIFNQTSRLMVDMSTAMGTDAKSSAIQLGKALNDPAKGLTALSRVGVSFTEQQKKQIEGFVEAGDTMKAQKVILGELERQFGGAAEAMATPGDKARTAFANLQEQLGTALLPAWDAVLNAFVAATPAISSAISGIGPVLSSLAGFIAPVFEQIQGFFSGGSGGGLVSSLQSFGAAVQSNFLPVLQTMAATFTGTVLPAITTLATYLAAQLFPVFQQIAGIITSQVLPIVASLATFFYGTLYPAIVQVATAVISNLKPVFDQLVATFRGQVLPTVEALLAKFREWQPTLQAVIAVVVRVIGKVIEFAAAILGKVLPVAIKLVGFLIGTLVPAVAKVIGIAVKVIAKVIEFGSALVNGGKKVSSFAGLVVDLAQRGLQLLVDAVTELPGKIMALGGRFLDAGKAIIGKFVDGLKGAGGLVSDIAGNVWSAVKGMLNDAIGKINAALEFTISLPGPDVPINPPNIPYLATGTNFHKGGLAVVGERGPELVNLPRGSQVIPNHKSVGELRGLGGDDAVLAEFRALRAAVERIAPGVGKELNGAVSAAERRAS